MISRRDILRALFVLPVAARLGTLTLRPRDLPVVNRGVTLAQISEIQRRLVLPHLRELLAAPSPFYTALRGRG